jgi:hypothetical protein
MIILKQPNPPSATSTRTVIDSALCKAQLMEISEQTGETLKEIVMRLVEKEYKEMKGE